MKYGLKELKGIGVRCPSCLNIHPVDLDGNLIIHCFAPREEEGQEEGTYQTPFGHIKLTNGQATKVICNCGKILIFLRGNQ